MAPNGLIWPKNGSKWPKNDISEMSRFTRFARHKFSADRHLKLFCTPGWYFATQLLSLHSGSSEPHWVYDWKYLRHWKKLSNKYRSYLMGQNIVAVLGWDASAHLADQQKLWSPASHPPIETPLLFRDCSLCSY